MDSFSIIYLGSENNFWEIIHKHGVRKTIAVLVVNQGTIKYSPSVKVIREKYGHIDLRWSCLWSEHVPAGSPHSVNASSAKNKYKYLWQETDLSLITMISTNAIKLQELYRSRYRPKVFNLMMVRVRESEGRVVTWGWGHSCNVRVRMRGGDGWTNMWMCAGDDWAKMWGWGLS